MPFCASYSCTFFLVHKTIVYAHLPSINSPSSSYFLIFFLISLIRLLSSRIYFPENTEIRWQCQWYARWFTRWLILLENEEQSCAILSMGCNCQSGPSRQLKLIFLKSWWKKESISFWFFFETRWNSRFCMYQYKTIGKMGL